MKLYIVILLSLLSGAIFCQNNVYKNIKFVSIQINKISADSIELVYNVDFEAPENIFISLGGPTVDRPFKDNENFVFKAKKDSLMKFTIPPYFLSNSTLVVKKENAKIGDYDLPYYSASFFDQIKEEVYYHDTIGNGTFVIIPNDIDTSYRALGVFNLLSQGYSFDEKLRDGELLSLNKIPAIAISINEGGNSATPIIIGHNILQNSKDEPEISGVRLMTATIQIDGNQPALVGYDFKETRKKEMKLINGIPFYYYPAITDRFENGSFMIKRITLDEYMLTGVYAYFGRLYTVNQKISSGEVIGIKEFVDLKIRL